jgi:hypothetical protein
LIGSASFAQSANAVVTASSLTFTKLIATGKSRAQAQSTSAGKPWRWSGPTPTVRL